jgi:putative heme-binding domain-containing protein
MTQRSLARGPGRCSATLLAAATLFVALPRDATAGADAPGTDRTARRDGLFARDNLVAWCIVPFDSRKRAPEERAAMLERLGFRRFAYDWRAEHVPSFDAELEALKRHGITLQAFWLAPGELNADARRILDLLRRHQVRTELWVILDLGNDRAEGAEQDRRVEAAAAKLRPLAEAAHAIGCTIGLYNHGGWFGEPENQLQIIDRLKRDGVANVGIVYNLHHGHAHLDRLGPLLAKIRPHLLAVNLNGMERDGESTGRKILPLGQGTNDLELLRIIEASGYRGPIGILGHTMDDAEERLRDNLDGLDWLVAQLHGRPAGPRPTPRTPLPKARPQSAARADAPAADPPAYDPQRVARLVADARASGDPQRGAEVFLAPQFGCASCHALGEGHAQAPAHGHGAHAAAPVGVGPALANLGKELSPEQIVESILWPRRQVKEGYSALVVATADGKQVQGYKQSETAAELVLREAATGATVRIARKDVDDLKEQGTLMPEGLASAMTDRQRADLVRFLMELGHADHATTERWLSRSHGPASFPYSREPLRPELWPNWQAPVNRDRVYDFYAKEADYFGKQPSVPMLLPPYPGLDGGRDGHWGNQNDDTWIDGRWNETDLGPVASGVFRGAGVTVPKAVCVRLGEHGEMAACFNPETLCYEALWKGGFVKFSSRRHGFLDGLALAGTPLPRPEGKKPAEPFVYRGFYRHGNRVVFAYRIGGTEMLDAPWVEDGKFTRVVAPASEHPQAALTRGGPAQWPQEIATRGKLGTTGPYAVDTIEPPFDNPWKALMFFGDHDFLPDGSALLCTMQGEVWRARGLDATLESVRWRRFATGLHEALGLVVAEGRVYVQGRDQITRLHDLNGDGEADFYECVTNAYKTSPAGHDFIAGLQRDRAGNFYTVSGNQGLLKLSPDGRVEVLATGFRNPDGLGLSPDGAITVPCSEGDWTPASMICAIKPGGFYGYGGPKKNQPPDLPLVYLPRGLDNSSGGQVTVTSDRWGPLKGQLLHFSFGMGTHFLVLRDQDSSQPQGAVVPLPGDFLSGVHRGRFNPRDGQLYVSGLGGWGTYTPRDGCFQRVRYTGERVQLPVEFHARENGVLVKFSSPVDRALASQAKNHFAQVWNYRYGSAYGSPEFSPRHPGMPGHDPLAIRSARVLDDGQTLFLELPEIQPVSQLHLHLKVDAGPPLDLFATVHKLAEPYRDFPGYTPEARTIAAHPILSDLALATRAVPNRWRRQIRNAREINIQAGKNLTYTVSSFEVKPGEPIRINFGNPDVVPHNWVLIRQGSLPRVGDLVNKLVADPEAAARHYVPRTDDVLAATDMVFPQGQTSIYFVAPTEKGRYPFLCSFPGHWMIMNGVMVVK